MILKLFPQGAQRCTDSAAEPRLAASRLAPWVVLIAALLLLASCGRGGGPTVLGLRGATMGTTYSVQIVEPATDLDRAALAERIEARLAAINAQMSTYQPDSELSRFNASPSTDWCPVSEELVSVLKTAQGVSRASGGAFDVTVGPLVNLWGFGPTVSAEALPTAGEIAAARARVGWQQLRLREQPPAVRKTRADLSVDLSAIAKGYAVDRIAELLESADITDYLVEIGGELRGRGRNGRGQPWQIAIERPETDKRAIFRVVALRDLGMATSGDYRNFFEVEGRRYSHTIDPATGRPVGHQLASVTVLAESTMRADAWATALLVLGPDRGMGLAEERGLAALFIEHAGETFEARASDAFDALNAD
ncbi:MAG: FAD:protein FMN transferase ApbE [Gammaproteobacteria bacterium]|jgi:thiamine biosynthesis lipoprotein|nr:FAD:protein FMN transferase ApbE [Gammaproteobacteria bacterium]